MSLTKVTLDAQGQNQWPTPSTDLQALSQGQNKQAGEPNQLRAKFHEFVAGTFYKSLFRSLRQATPETGLMHGGRAEQIFRGRLDDLLTERMTQANETGFSERFFEQFLRQHGMADPASQPSSAESSALGSTNLGAP